MKTLSGYLGRFAAAFVIVSGTEGSAAGADGSRFAHSDSNARFLHHIALYDANDRKITPESTQPYSPRTTCGRCHDYEAISHGWHFNAFLPDTVDGRDGEPWIWTDARTGTQLPLRYRDWKQGFDPRKIGISAFEMTHQFGGRIPGGGPGIASSGDAAEAGTTDAVTAGSDDAAATATESAAAQAPASRWSLTGQLDVDCMVCHAVSGAYDFNGRREQIEKQNFGWSATAGLRLGKIDGDVSRIKDDADPSDAETQERLPKVTYDAGRFAIDGTVFMDLVRKPPSNSCYQCHSNRTVSEAGIEPRWVHDDDVHLRAGMECADCHRNGIDHHMVRGFDGEEHPSGQSVETLSCAGCHLGKGGHEKSVHDDVMARAGRLGAPKPLHAGLPLVHFEKLTCTACHAGPVPREQALGIMTSFAHGLGSEAHRDGSELPRIAGPVYTKMDDGAVAPQRAMWPAYWAVINEGKAEPISPERTYDITRRKLRVRRNFVDELLKPELRSGKLRELLGEERAKLDPIEWSEEEQRKVDEAQAQEGRALFNEKIYASLEALEQELGVEQAAYISTGFVYVRGEEENSVKTIELSDSTSTAMVTWPIAHHVRPAGWSLGVGGCLECHHNDGKIFASNVAPTGPGPDAGQPVTMASLQGIPANQQLVWNQLFTARKGFKYAIGGCIAVLSMTILVGIGVFGARLAGRREQAA
jgi:hypothetical protein